MVQENIITLKEAFELFQVAARHHISQAEHFIALMYEYGLGVTQNFELAEQYYTFAVEKSYPESVYNLALMYTYQRISKFKELQIQFHYERALSLFHLCANMNHIGCIYYIGLFKFHGYGCERNYEQSVNWFEKAASLDDFRGFNEKARVAAIEIQTLLNYANIKNQQTIDHFQSMSEER